MVVVAVVVVVVVVAVVVVVVDMRTPMQHARETWARRSGCFER